MNDADTIDAYARAVVDGVLPAGKYHRLSCARPLADRSRQATDGFPYLFDTSKIARFCSFASKLRHYKGEWAKTPIVLEPYQRFRLGSLFGCVHKETGLGRFRTSAN